MYKRSEGVSHQGYTAYPMCELDGRYNGLAIIVDPNNHPVDKRVLSCDGADQKEALRRAIASYLSQC